MKNSFLVVVLFFIGYAFAAVSAQQTFKIDLQRSSMKVMGTSTLHDWEMQVEDFQGVIFLLEKFNKLEQIEKGSISVKVRSIKSNHSLMNDKTYDALKEKDYPTIKIIIQQVNQQEDKGNVTVELSIAGKKKIIKDDYSCRKTQDGNIEISGLLDLKMSDFEIKPPVALLGTIKTGDKVQVQYRLEFKKV
jgi:hypothetical protein